jgi:hypothetical protein
VRSNLPKSQDWGESDPTTGITVLLISASVFIVLVISSSWLVYIILFSTETHITLSNETPKAQNLLHKPNNLLPQPLPLVPFSQASPPLPPPPRVLASLRSLPCLLV